MSTNFIPKHHISDIRLDDVELDIPKELQEDLKLNPKFVNLFYRKLVESIVLTMRHPDTAPNIITKDEIKRRGKLCLKLICMMRYDTIIKDGKVPFTLKRAFELMPERLFDHLREDRHPGTIMQEKDQRMVYSREKLGMAKYSNKEDHTFIIDKADGDLAKNANDLNDTPFAEIQDNLKEFVPSHEDCDDAE